jgi:hypothetical protein
MGTTCAPSAACSKHRQMVSKQRQDSVDNTLAVLLQLPQQYQTTGAPSVSTASSTGRWCQHTCAGKSMYSQTTSTLYFSCAEMGTTGAPSACTAKQHKEVSVSKSVDNTLAGLLELRRDGHHRRAVCTQQAAQADALQHRHKSVLVTAARAALLELRNVPRHWRTTCMQQHSSSAQERQPHRSKGPAQLLCTIIMNYTQQSPLYLSGLPCNRHAYHS